MTTLRLTVDEGDNIAKVASAGSATQMSQRCMLVYPNTTCYLLLALVVSLLIQLTFTVVYTTHTHTHQHSHLPYFVCKLVFDLLGSPMPPTALVDWLSGTLTCFESGNKGKVVDY